MRLSVELHKKLGDFSLDVSFEAGEEVLGLLGASGSGKSMTLKCIAGIETPDSGRILLNGVPLFDSEKGINLPPQKRKVGYLFQQYALFPNMTVEQNILCGLRWERSREARQAELRRVVSLLGLEGLERHKPGQISGGQAQRVALARILVNRPQLLLLDEPFAALDSHLRERLQLELRELLRQYGRPALFVTHSRDEAYRLCASIAVLEEGRLLARAKTQALFADPGSISVARLTGCKNLSPARPVGAYAVEALDWGLRFTTAKPVEGGLLAVGIRAHSFSPEEVQNRFSVRWGREMEEPFEWIAEFRAPDQRADSPALWWRYPKALAAPRRPQTLGVKPEEVLLLYRT